LIRQNIVDEKERLERVEREEAERSEAKVEFDKLNERRAELGMSELTIDSYNEFNLNGYHNFTLENLQLIRDSISEKEQEIERQRQEREREEHQRREAEARAKAECKRKMDKEEAEHMASSPFAVLAQLKGKLE